MGGTLIHAERERRMALHCGVPFADAAAAIQETDRYFMARERESWHRGGPGYARRWALMVIERLGAAVEVDEVSDLARAQPGDWRVFPDTFAVLEDLQRRGYTCALVSNWDPGGRRIATRLGLADHLRPMVFSAEINCEKPAAEIFQHALQALGATAAEAIYVGDNYWDDVIGARRAGILPVLLDRLAVLPHPGHGDCPLVTDLRGVAAWLGRAPAHRELAAAD